VAKQVEKRSNKAAKMLYQPFGLVSSVVAGVVAGQVFQRVWKRAVPGDHDDPPNALQSEYTWQEVLVGALIQGAVFSVVRAAVSRGGARLFERWTGEWPGD